MDDGPIATEKGDGKGGDEVEEGREGGVRLGNTSNFRAGLGTRVANCPPG